MITQLIHRELYDPHWTEVEYKSVLRGRDFLGVETLSESILADLLPGINNQTRRARYYSFWAWVLRDFINDPGVKHTQDNFYAWLRKREDALILAYLAHDCQSGIAGTDQAGEVWGDGSKTAYPLDWKSLLSVDGGAYELYYRGALQEMNIVVANDESNHDNLTKTIGLSLADAYAQSVANTEYVQTYLDATRLSKAALEDFAEYGCLCQLPQFELERRALIDAFFRFDSPDAYAIKRLASICLFLDIIGQSQGQPLTNQLDLRSVLYFWSYTDKHVYQPAGNLLEPAQRWRSFQLRQYFVFAIQSFWSLFLNRIDGQTMSDEAYLDWVLTDLDLAELANELDFDLPTTDAYALSVRTFYEAIRDALPEGTLGPGPAAYQTKLNERLLTNPIWGRRTNLDIQVRAGKALLTLVLIYWRCQPWRDEPGWIYASDRYAAGHHPLESYLRHVERAFAEEWSLARWLGWFHHRYLWLQHRRVTLEKLISRRQDTAKFEVLDTAPPELHGNGDSAKATFFRGLDTDRPKMNAPRFPSILSIMSDLKLILSTEQGGYELTPDGIALLEQFRTYSVPAWQESVADSPEDTTLPQLALDDDEAAELA
ncbi:hypothetical protein ACFLXQ_03655 [Chloroflexota bacterium]